MKSEDRRKISGIESSSTPANEKTVFIGMIGRLELQRRKSKRRKRRDGGALFFFYLSGRDKYSCADFGISSSTCWQDKTRKNISR